MSSVRPMLALFSMIALSQVGQSTALAGIIHSQTAFDGRVRRNKTTSTLSVVSGLTGELVGESGGVPLYTNVALSVFQLPDFGLVNNPFLTASYNGYLSETNQTNPSIIADLYGLNRRSSGTIQTTDFFLGDFGTDASDAYSIHDSFLRFDGVGDPDNTPAGAVVSSGGLGPAQQQSLTT